MNAYNSPATKPLYRGTQIVWYVLGLLEAVLALRFLFKLLGANAASGFVNFIYDLTYPFVVPFNSVFRTQRVEGNIFEWTTLLAMVIYWLVAWAIVKLFVMKIGRAHV